MCTFWILIAFNPPGCEPTQESDPRRSSHAIGTVTECIGQERDRIQEVRAERTEKEKGGEKENKVPEVTRGPYKSVFVVGIQYDVKIL